MANLPFIKKSQGDLHPTQGKKSAKTTQPPVATSAISRKQPISYSQFGYATNYASNGDIFLRTYKPTHYRLAAWDDCRRNESIVKQGLDYLINSIVSRLSQFSHPNSQIEDFVQENIDGKLSRWVRVFTESILWSGFGLDEILWEKKYGPNGIPQVWLDDLVNYHPLHIYVIANDWGIIKDGEQVTGSPYKSGLWIPIPPTHMGKPGPKADRVGNLIRLYKSKRVYATYRGDGNNIYGRPLVDDGVHKWYMFKQLFVDLLWTALGRYGTPLIWVKVPPHDTREVITEPDGTERLKTLQELTAEQLQNLDNNSALVFTQLSTEQPVEIGSLTTGNNFADSFTQAIELCDDNITASLSIPNLIMKDKVGGMSSGGSSETQIQMFNLMVESVSDYVLAPIVNQAILQLIQYNFDVRTVKDADKAGKIELKPARAADLKVILDGINNIAQRWNLKGGNDTISDNDLRHVKSILGFPTH